LGSATIRTEIDEDKYPIGRFILHRARTLGLSRSDLVHRLGYRDDSGYEALNGLLLTGIVAPHVSNRLADVLEVDDTPVGSVIGATMWQKRDEVRLDHPLWKLTDTMRGDKRGRRVESERAYCASFRRRRNPLQTPPKFPRNARICAKPVAQFPARSRSRWHCAADECHGSHRRAPQTRRAPRGTPSG
jgi:hypothetical protein